MLSVARITPALLRRAFFFCALLASGAAASAATPPGPLPELAQVGKPNPEEAARLVEQFRNSGIPGDYYLEFELRSLLRRGEGETLKGRWWGSRNDIGAITRIEITDANGQAHRLLLQNGQPATVWRLTKGRPVEVGLSELMTPLVPGLEVSAFDLQMPFLYWPGVTVDKITRVLGRPAHAFWFPAPAEFTAQFPDILGVRAYFDAQYNVPMQTELIGRDNRPTKTLSLREFRTIERQTIPKSADYRNEVTRDKTRLQVTAAALGLELPAPVFQPATLTQPGSLPPAGEIVPIDP